MPHQQNNTQPLGTPFVSFIVPVYNIPEDMLNECIDSILELSLQPDEREIILVDDGSDEKTANGAKKLSKHILYIRTPHNGVSVARNTGLRMAQGRFVQFVDGDDKLIRQPYEHALQLARQEDCNMVMFDYSDSYNSDSDFRDESWTSGTELMHRSNIHGSSCGYLFRRNLLGTLQFTPDVAYGEDEEFTAQLLLRAENVKRTSAKAYFYRNRPTSAIHTPNMQKQFMRLDDNKQVIFRLTKQLDSLPVDSRNALERRIAQLTMDYIYNTILISRSLTLVDEKLKELHEKGLFPLPRRNYTSKYKWFRRMTSNSLGLQLLMHVLPMMKKEK